VTRALHVSEHSTRADNSVIRRALLASSTYKGNSRMPRRGWVAHSAPSKEARDNRGSLTGLTEGRGRGVAGGIAAFALSLEWST